MNYKIGDAVVCIDAMGLKKLSADSIFAGREYVIRSQAENCVSLVGLLSSRPPEAYCSKCGVADGHWHYAPYRFIKLPKVTSRTEVTSEAAAE